MGTKRRNKRSRIQNVDKDRRRILGYGILGAGVIATVGTGFWFFGGDDFDDLEFDFLRRYWDDSFEALERMGYRDLLSIAIPLTKLGNSGRSRTKEERIWSELKKIPDYIAKSQEIRRAGGSSYVQVASFKTQLFGVPETNGVYSKHYLNYTRMIWDHFCNSLEGIYIPDLSWHDLRGVKEVKDTGKAQGFVAHSYFQDFFGDIELWDKSDITEEYESWDREGIKGEYNIHYRINRIGGFANIPKNIQLPGEEEKRKQLPYPVLVVSTAADEGMALVSPISEGGPLIVHKATEDYMRELRKGGMEISEAMNNGRLVEEALTEGVSHVFIRSIYDKLPLNNPSALTDALNAMVKYYPHWYRYVPLGLRYVERYGINDSLKLYMDSPGKFLEAIKKVA